MKYAFIVSLNLMVVINRNPSALLCDHHYSSMIHHNLDDKAIYTRRPLEDQDYWELTPFLLSLCLYRTH